MHQINWIRAMIQNADLPCLLEEAILPLEFPLHEVMIEPVGLISTFTYKSQSDCAMSPFPHPRSGLSDNLQ